VEATPRPFSEGSQGGALQLAGLLCCRNGAESSWCGYVARAGPSGHTWSQQPKRDKHFVVGVEPEGAEPAAPLDEKSKEKGEARSGDSIRLPTPKRCGSVGGLSPMDHPALPPAARPTGSAALRRNASVSTAGRRGRGIRRGRTLAATEAGGKPLLATGREGAEGNGRGPGRPLSCVAGPLFHVGVPRGW